MSIASIDRGIFTTVDVDVDVENRFIAIESGSNGIKLTRSEAEQLIQALQQAIEELPEEPKYVVLLPQESNDKHWEYFYLHYSGKIFYGDSPRDVLSGGAMSLDKIKAIGEQYVHFVIPVEEFKEKYLEGEC
ncbi:leucine-tRNA ligase [Enterococcus phage Entf1]|nr:leucine-tRNA ligase [Enterococcus phage Entf1]